MEQRPASRPRGRSRSAAAPRPTSVSAPQEIELKLAVPRSALPALRARLATLGRSTVQRLETIYFDTPDLLLAREGMALRVRRTPGGWVQTLKTGAARSAFSRRGEWETPIPSGRPQLGRLRGCPLPAPLQARGRPALTALFSTRFARTTRTVAQGRSQVEVALDRGEIVAGRGKAARRLPLLELELELKSGRPPA